MDYGLRNFIHQTIYGHRLVCQWTEHKRKDVLHSFTLGIQTELFAETELWLRIERSLTWACHLFVFA